jgi:hypothetical protein
MRIDYLIWGQLKTLPGQLLARESTACLLVMVCIDPTIPHAKSELDHV